MNDEEWIELTPRLVHRPPEDGKVTVALAVPPVGTAVLRMNLSRVIGQAVGWQAKDKVKIAVAKSGKRIRVMKVAEPKKGDGGFTIGLRGTTLTVTIRLHWLMPLREGRPAEQVVHSIAGEAIVLDMPEWAHAPEGALQDVAPVTAPPVIVAPVPVPVPVDDLVVVSAPAAPPPAKPAAPKPPTAKKDVMAAIGQIGRKPAAAPVAETPGPLPLPPVVDPTAKPLSALEAADADEKEGKDMLAKGRSVREVAAWLGEDLGVVRDWKRQVEEAAAAKAAAEQGSAAA